MLQLVSEVVVSQGILELVLELQDALFALLAIDQPPFIELRIDLFLLELGVRLKTEHFACYSFSNLLESSVHVAFELLSYA